MEFLVVRSSQCGLLLSLCGVNGSNLLSLSLGISLLSSLLSSSSILLGRDLRRVLISHNLTEFLSSLVMGIDSLLSKLRKLEVRKSGLVRRNFSFSLLLSLELLRVDLASLEFLGHSLLLSDHRISSVALEFDTGGLNVTDSILMNNLLKVSRFLSRLLMKFISKGSSCRMKFMSLFLLSSGDLLLKGNSLLVIGEVVLLSLENLSLDLLLLIEDA